MSLGSTWPLLALALAVAWHTAAGLDNGVGRTPAMGWNSWNTFRCNINETLIKEVADAMGASGLRDAGYQYVNIDDCWMHERDAQGVLQPNATKFPSGMKALGDYIHSKGLKFGIYSDAGNKTCEGYPASWGHEQQDAKTFAEWGVDYLKYDYCGMDAAKESTKDTYKRMGDALLASGRPILFSLCSWGAGAPWEWGHEVGHSWRVSPDAFAAWDKQQVEQLALPNFLISITEAVEVAQQHAAYARPGGFNDADMLVVGLDGMYPYGVVQKCPPHVVGCKPGDYISRDQWGMVGGLSLMQQRTHFLLYCMLASPLILGNDPRRMRRETLEILTAPEVLKIHQDPLGKQAIRVLRESDNHGVALWRKDLTGKGRVAVLLVNHKPTVQDVVVDFTKHLKDLHEVWARTLKEPPPPPCTDRKPACVEWASNGECEKNPGFMLAECKKSCRACKHESDTPALAAVALVRDAWEQEDLGPASGHFAVLHVDPYEGRLLVFTFMEPDEAWAAHQQQLQQPAYALSPATLTKWAASPLMLPGSREHQPAAAAGGGAPSDCQQQREAAAAAEQRSKRLGEKVNELSAQLSDAKSKLRLTTGADTLQLGRPIRNKLQPHAAVEQQQQQPAGLAPVRWWSDSSGGGFSKAAIMLFASNAVWLTLVAAVCIISIQQRRAARYKLKRYVY